MKRLGMVEEGWVCLRGNNNAPNRCRNAVAISCANKPRNLTLSPTCNLSLHQCNPFLQHFVLCSNSPKTKHSSSSQNLSSTNFAHTFNESHHGCLFLVHGSTDFQNPWCIGLLIMMLYVQNLLHIWTWINLSSLVHTIVCSYLFLHFNFFKGTETATVSICIMSMTSENEKIQVPKRDSSLHRMLKNRSWRLRFRKGWMSQMALISWPQCLT